MPSTLSYFSWTTDQLEGGGNAADTVKLIEGVFDAEEKHEMIEQLTETMVGIEVRACAE